MDEAFDPKTIWIWDTAFMTFFTRYAPARFPGVQSLRNFYEPMHHGGARPFVIQHPDNPPLFAWAEYANWRLAGVCSEGEATPGNLARTVANLAAHYEWFEKVELGFHLGGQWTALKAVRDHQGMLLGFQWNGVASGMDNTPRTRAGAGMLWLDAIAQHGLSALYLSRLSASSAGGRTASRAPSRSSRGAPRTGCARNTAGCAPAACMKARSPRPSRGNCAPSCGNSTSRSCR
jgi:hypothetical protein